MRCKWVSVSETFPNANAWVKRPGGASCESELQMLCSGMALPYPTIIPGLRSPSYPVGGLVYFGRMLDKMRLAAAGKLPEGWQPMRGTAIKNSFDDRCCKFLRIDYAALE